MPFALTAYEAGQNLGTIVLAVLFVLLLLRAFDVLPRKQPTPRGRLTDLGVAAILGVLLTVAFFNGRADAWEGVEARAMKADFIAALYPTFWNLAVSYIDDPTIAVFGNGRCWVEILT